MIADDFERKTALDPLRSFIVQAPAGSGKTDLLVKRYVKLLATVRQPEEVLAITFTIKAAAEMRQRVLKSLPDSGEIANRLRIQTIDALCASLTRRMPVLSRFGATPELIEDARAHYREAAKRTLHELSAPAVTLLSHLDNNTGAATGLLASMLAKRDQWLRTTGAVPSREELETNLALERERLLAAARELDPRASPEFALEVLTKEGTWRKRSGLAQTLSDNEALRLALSRLIDMPPAKYTDYQWEVLEAILKLLPYAAAHLKVVFGERGECDFTEVAQGAVRALGTPDAPTDLLLALDYRIRHILVDEFQDTSNSQWELIERLTAGWERGDGRTLFLVGDPMQSIYRFREAEVALFLRAQREGVGGVPLERLTLSTNFRSQAGLVSFFNGSFEAIFPREEDPSSGAVPYSSAVPHPENVALPGEAASWSFHADRQAEARAVVDLVKSSRERTAILVRNRESLAAIVPLLKQDGIRFRAIEIEKLGEKQVVQDLYALTRALSHLGDRIAWLSVLRAPWCALTLADLHALCHPPDKGGSEPKASGGFAVVFDLLSDLSGLSPEGRRNAARLRDVITPAISNRSRGTLRDRVEGVWLALGGPACIEDKTELEDAEIFFDQLESLERAGELEDMGALAEALEQLYALPDVAAGDDDLQIMTIHKAKGLEFGTVIVPGLDRVPGHSDPPLFLWKERVGKRSRAGRLLLAPIKETGSKGDPAYQYLAALDSEAEKMEAGRLLYVAATRAKHRLHLLGCLRCDDDGAAKEPYSHSLLARAWPVAEQHASSFVAPHQVSPGERRKAFTSFTRLLTDLTDVRPADPARWAAPPEGRQEEIEFSWAGETARHVGSVVHRWLQKIADDELRGWDTDRIKRLAPLFRKDLTRRGVQSSSLNEAVSLVGLALIRTMSDERGRWLLGPHKDAKTEFRLRTAASSTYIVDRYFVDETGRRWIVDWKTSRHEGKDLEAFIDNEQARYAPQLERYRRALSADRAGLYFPLLTGWRELQ